MVWGDDRTLWMKLTSTVELFFFLLYFWAKVLQKEPCVSACILNICVDVRSTLVALFYVVNIFLASNL